MMVSFMIVGVAVWSVISGYMHRRRSPASTMKTPSPSKQELINSSQDQSSAVIEVQQPTANIDGYKKKGLGKHD